jgi:hypothetical protein
MNDNSLFSCSFLVVCRTDSRYTSEDSLHSRHAMACRALMTSAIFLLITAVLVDSHLALAQQPTASNDNCFLITIANLPAQTPPIEACLQLGQPTSLSIPGIGNLVLSILMPNQDTQLCPYGTTPISSETAGTPLILCMSIS